MNYTYQKRSTEQLEQIAETVLTRFVRWRSGSFVDMEGVVEECGITVIPRRGLKKLVNGYLPRDPRYIVIDETYAGYPPSYREILAEEFCHILLEYDLLTAGKVEESWQPHKMSLELHQTIEADAHYLTRAISMARDIFIPRWKECYDSAPPSVQVSRQKHLAHCAQALEDVFRCWTLKIAYRARDLGMMSEEECRKFFSDRIPL